MFELAFKARIPVIGVHTDDLVNFEAVLHQLTDFKVHQLTSATQKLAAKLYWTDDVDLVTVGMYNKLMESEHQLVVINAGGPHSLIFDTGTLPTPEPLVDGYLNDVMGEGDHSELKTVLRGMSLKSIGEVVMLTQARTGGTLASEVRRTRQMVSGGVQGLYSLDTAVDFYEFPDRLIEWLKLNDKYFLDPKTPRKLVPRGALLDGFPGVGKTLGAKAIANHFGIPLFRLDIATTLNRYIGESENRIMRSLQMIERESPCVLLIDEVEKAINGKDESGVTDRILAQLLWWLAEHTSRIITVMTTNDMAALPPELYRQGRIDIVIKIPRMSLGEAQKFAGLVFKNVVGKPAKAAQTLKMSAALKATERPEFSHAEVSELVYTEIKRYDWMAA